MTERRPLKILVVCTANVCRSAMAEAFLRDRLPSSFLVRSCGLLATGQHDPDPRAIAAAAELGAHVALRPGRPLGDADLHDADLILGLTTRHVRDVVVRHRPTFSRAFTMPELVERGREVGPPRPGEELRDWLARLHEGRRTSDLTVARPGLDVADPTGGETAGYRTTAALLADLAERTAELLGPLGLPHRATPGPADGQITLIADPAAEPLLRLAAAQGRDVVRRSVDRWQAAVPAVREVVSAGLNVICLTTEPHGVAMLVNRHEPVRAVVVANAGAARRAMRVLGANVVCASSHLDAGALGLLLEVCGSEEGRRGE